MRRFGRRRLRARASSGARDDRTCRFRSHSRKSWWWESAVGCHDGCAEPHLHATIARTLALCERRLRESVDAPEADLGLTQIEGVVKDVADVLGPVLEALDAAAKEMELPAQKRDHRAGARAALSLVWADLMELDPGHMRRAYGSDDLPEAWPAARGELIAAVERALAQLDD